MFNWLKEKFKGKQENIENIDNINNEQIKENIESVKENIEDIAKEKIDNISDIAEEIKESIEEKLEIIDEKTEHITEDIDENIDSIKENIEEKIDDFKNSSEDAKKSIEDKLEVIDEKTEQITEDIGENIDSIKENIEEKIEDIKDTFIEQEHNNIKDDTELEIDSITQEEVIEINEENNNELIQNLSEVEVIKEISEIDDTVEKGGFFQRLKKGLTKTRQEISVKINTVLGSYVKIDDEMMEDLEDVLISADIGMETTMKLIDNLRETIIQNKINDPNQVMPLLKEEIKKVMNPNLDAQLQVTKPTVILVIGVNGVGKTTTIGKLSARLKNEGKNVLIVAADTFRAAAIDQLKTWGNRANVDVISHSEGADPAAVIFDGITAAKSRDVDVLICDTAGRLHNKANLMKELEKINKIISRDFPQANRETLLVLDSTTGQNALSQAKTFKEVAEISGIVLTKLDGTAKGGVVIALQSELEIPIKLIGVGEKIEDLQTFDMNSFVDAILE